MLPLFVSAPPLPIPIKPAFSILFSQHQLFYVLYFLMSTETSELTISSSSDKSNNNSADGTVTIPILHFNDVYRVQPQKLAGGVVIDVTQFAYMVNALRAAWPLHRPVTATDGADTSEREGLVLFSGDLFSPSVESSVTRGSHMVRLLLCAAQLVCCDYVSRYSFLVEGACYRA